MPRIWTVSVHGYGRQIGDEVVLHSRHQRGDEDDVRDARSIEARPASSDPATTSSSDMRVAERVPQGVGMCRIGQNDKEPRHPDALLSRRVPDCIRARLVPPELLSGQPLTADDDRQRAVERVKEVARAVQILASHG